MIKVADISKNFAETKAVSSLSFQVKKGEIFGIVGPDGAGKSTLMRLISGILIPNQGKIEINGIDVHKSPYIIKENLAYMPQRFGLYEDLTVEENIYFFGKLFGVSVKGIKKRIKRLYEFSRLEPFSGRLAGNLSGGMKQKLGLACSLIHSPHVVLLDEPTNGVDPVSRREFWKILYDLLAEGVTIVVSTAYLDEAERCNRIALMYNGNFITIGQPADIKSGIGKIMLEITPDDIWKAEMAMRSSSDFTAVIREGTALKIFVSNQEKAVRSLRLLFKKNKIKLCSVMIKAPTLENCFFEIISSKVTQGHVKRSIQS